MSHLGAILEIGAFKIAPSIWDREWGHGFLLILGPILGPKIVFFFTFWGVIFWTSFWTISGPLWGPFWGPQKRDPKMDDKIINFLTNFGTILGSILEPKSFQKGVPKLDQFWNPLPPHLRGPNDAILGIKREW